MIFSGSGGNGSRAEDLREERAQDQSDSILRGQLAHNSDGASAPPTGDSLHAFLILVTLIILLIVNSINSTAQRDHGKKVRKNSVENKHLYVNGRYVVH